MDLLRGGAVLLLCIALIPGCAKRDEPVSGVGRPLSPGDPQATPPGEAAVSEGLRDTTEAPSEDVRSLAEGNAAFALDLLRAVGSDNANTMISPHSISLALAMAYAGAGGATRDEMRKTLHFTLDDAKLHAALGSLDLLLSRAAAPGKGSGDDMLFTLDIVNQMYAQKGLVVKPDYLDTLSVHYGAGLRLMDFAGDPNGARRQINDWVAKRTRDRVKDLLPERSVHELTTCVLVNAVYFLARWMEEFEADRTKEQPFYPAEGEQVTVSMMHKTESMPYAEGLRYQAVSLSYRAKRPISMVVILPEQGTLDSFLSSLDAARLRAILDALASRAVWLSLPKFEFESAFSLKDALQGLGMTTAFEETADFSGISDTPMWIEDVHHKTFVAVHEKGTEAAAATAVMMEKLGTPEEPAAMTVDHPFLFLIRDDESGEVLFLGRVTSP